eukprot:TRINITY_DN31145_c0_g1_i1.p1 TRINITY_DN31145_c0_g1~~TRINITY_DN31145_c0_g1_i1.p1  ORF type:complete len:125 (-),score=7.44 TRINITY_DN31145_c0_g1_i1:1284-1658(-)
MLIFIKEARQYKIIGLTSQQPEKYNKSKSNNEPITGENTKATQTGPTWEPASPKNLFLKVHKKKYPAKVKSPSNGKATTFQLYMHYQIHRDASELRMNRNPQSNNHLKPVKQNLPMTCQVLKSS